VTLPAVLHFLPYGVAIWLAVVGLFGLTRSRNFIHLTLCLTILQASTYLLLLSVGYRTGGQPPIARGATAAPFVDPIVQALTLTDIVVGATVTALLLSMAVQLHNRGVSLDPESEKPFRK
jgi:multicomponent Na+:H+ antiporter subunit C